MPFLDYLPYILFGINFLFNLFICFKGRNLNLKSFSPLIDSLSSFVSSKSQSLGKSSLSSDELSKVRVLLSSLFEYLGLEENNNA